MESWPLSDRLDPQPCPLGIQPTGILLVVDASWNFNMIFIRTDPPPMVIIFESAAMKSSEP